MRVKRVRFRQSAYSRAPIEQPSCWLGHAPGACSTRRSVVRITCERGIVFAVFRSGGGRSIANTGKIVITGQTSEYRSLNHEVTYSALSDGLEAFLSVPDGSLMIAEACGCAPVSADPSAADFRFGRGFGPPLPLGTALAGTEAGTLQRAVVNMKSSATGARPHDGSLGASEFL